LHHSNLYYTVVLNRTMASFHDTFIDDDDDDLDTVALLTELVDPTGLTDGRLLATLKVTPPFSRATAQTNPTDPPLVL